MMGRLHGGSWTALAVVLFGLWGCDDGVGPTDAGDASVEDGGDGGPLTCDGDDECADEQHCLEGECVEDLCAPGASWCEESALMLCGERGSGGELVEDCSPLSCLPEGRCGCGDDEQCDAGQYCDDGVCQLQRCAPGSRSCDDGDVYECDDRGVEASQVEDCGELSCQSAACVCDSDDQCAADEHCGESGSCVDDLCPQGEHYCEGSGLYLCSDDGAEATLTEDCGVLSCAEGGCFCETSGQCAADEHCSAGGCEPDLCPRGTIYCADGAVQQCNADGSAEMEIQDCGGMVCRLGACTCTSDAHCDSSQHCDGGACVPDLCLHDTIYCSDGDVYQCNADGSAESQVEECGLLSCVDAACLCTDDGQCPTDQFCGAGGSCLDDRCEASALFCSGGDVQQCNDAGSASTLAEACGDLSCVDGACSCTADGQCAAAEHCDGGACVADICDQGELLCQEGDVYQCSSNGSSSSLLQDCGALDCDGGVCLCTDSAQCDDGEHCDLGVCVEDLCPPSTTYCREGDLWQCDASGATESLLEACGDLACADAACLCTENAHCPTTQHCGASGDCVDDLCAQGELYCQEGDLYQCADDGSGSTLAESCGELSCEAGACLCTADEQCPTLERCDGGVCVVDDATSGVHTDDTDVHRITGLSDVEIFRPTVGPSGQIAALLSPESPVAVVDLSTSVVAVEADGSLSFIAHNDDLAAHMGERYAHIGDLDATPSGDLVATNHAALCHDLLQIAPDGTITTLINGEALAAALGASSDGALGYDVEVAVDGDGTIYYWSGSLAALARITPTGEAELLATIAGAEDIRGIEADASGAVFLWDNDYDGRQFFRVSSGGAVSTWMTQAQIEEDVGGLISFRELTMDDSGALFAYDGVGDRVIRLSPSRVATVEVTSAAIATVAAHPFTADGSWIATGLAIEPAGTLLISWQQNDTLSRLFPDSDSGVELVSNTAVVDALGSGGYEIYAIAAADDGTIYGWDNASRSLLELDGPRTTALITIDDLEAADPRASSFFNFRGYGLAVGFGGRVYMADGDVFSYDPGTGDVALVADGDDIESALGRSFITIRSIAVGVAGDVYAHEYHDNAVVHVDADGTASVLHDFASTYTNSDLVLAAGETRLYVAEQDEDQLTVVDTTTGAASLVVAESTFDARVGSSFNPLSMAGLPDGDLLIFDGNGTYLSLTNEESVLRVHPSTGALSVELGTTALRGARGADEVVVLASITTDGDGTLYGLDSISNDILYWLP